ncbi:phosphotransferase enzyme family protein [Cohnella lupini]|uniref:Ser/Thr protein kinase RdoA (MazF antagonist) n=1 Tax=Cohnella lupini TaxID=1294267 RepID=A0A3D9I999_9BACL|nr:phosphotransferase [Cohnella lupini]RED58119.1 Ser/Thr protein kinase RdoA (MazF antagonist) [Cohnella lupini]
MLQLKYLFDNADLAKMILKNWEFDEASIDLLRYYRISSNAVYPFRSKGSARLLRFAPKSEKRKDQILAELEFTAYLRSRNYAALESVPSLEGMELIETGTPWGEYYASVFRRVSGEQLDKTDLGDAVIRSYGQALGRLHRLSSEYSPAHHVRWSYSDALCWMQEVLLGFPEETVALEEIHLLKQYFSTVPVTRHNFGLIHYDFEFDNVFYDPEKGACNVIDFDDSMYHWYAMDLEQAFDCIREHFSDERFPSKKQCFMDGYLAEYEVMDDYETILPACGRFANLYGYVRILRSASEIWANEPEWLRELRVKLAVGLQVRSSGFGMKLAGETRDWT